MVFFIVIFKRFDFFQKKKLKHRFMLFEKRVIFHLCISRFNMCTKYQVSKFSKTTSVYLKKVNSLKLILGSSKLDFSLPTSVVLCTILLYIASYSYVYRVAHRVRCVLDYILGRDIHIARRIYDRPCIFSK